jgi:hypothetical protein
MTLAGFGAFYNVEIFGDGVTTAFKISLTKETILGALQNTSLGNKGGLDLGSPIDVFNGSLPAGTTISLSGLVVTITPATIIPAGGVIGGSFGVIYSG